MKTKTVRPCKAWFVVNPLGDIFYRTAAETKSMARANYQSITGDIWGRNSEQEKDGWTIRRLEIVENDDGIAR